MIDPYLDPSTGLLRNKRGISAAGELAQVEADLAAIRDSELAAAALPGHYDLEHLCEFHRRLFGDLYPWAGQVRTVDLAKGSSRFCLVFVLHQFAIGEVFPKIAAYDYLRGLDHAELVDKLAETLGDVNALHPFREGNGRAQRAFFRQMLGAAGWKIDWSALDPQTNIAASAASISGNLGPLKGALAPLITPTSLNP